MVAAAWPGVYASVSDIGDGENISKSYVSRIRRLALLAPDIVDAIRAGRMDQALMREQLERPLPASWEVQRDPNVAAHGAKARVTGSLLRSSFAPRRACVVVIQLAVEDWLFEQLLSRKARQLTQASRRMGRSKTAILAT
jgi:hypothetical protein